MRLRLLVVVVLLGVEPLPAHYDDMHFHFTYYLARLTGYTHLQALRISGADLSIDYATNTEPVQAKSEAVSKVLPDPTSLYESWAHTPRIRFHAFMDCLNHPACMTDDAARARAQAAIPVERRRLERLAREYDNPGPLLHFVQDIIPHRGYPSGGGHWTSPTTALMFDLPMGATTDYLSYGPPERNRETINETLAILVSHLRSRRPEMAVPHDYEDPAVVRPYLELRRANSLHEAPTFSQALAENFDSPAEVYARWKERTEPDYEASAAAINAELAAQGATKLLQGGTYRYDFLASGAPGTRAGFRLFEALRVDLDTRGRPEEEYTVLVELPPSFPHRRPIELARQTGVSTVMFEDLPVGALRIRVLDGAREVAAQEFVLELPGQTERIDLSNSFFDSALSQYLTEMLRLEQEAEEESRELNLLLSDLDGALDELRGLAEQERNSPERLDTAAQEVRARVETERQARSRQRQAIEEVSDLAGDIEAWGRDVRAHHAGLCRTGGATTPGRAFEETVAWGGQTATYLGGLIEGYSEDQQRIRDVAAQNAQSREHFERLRADLALLSRLIERARGESDLTRMRRIDLEAGQYLDGARLTSPEVLRFAETGAGEAPGSAADRRTATEILEVRRRIHRALQDARREWGAQATGWSALERTLQAPAAPFLESLDDIDALRREAAEAAGGLEALRSLQAAVEQGLDRLRSARDCRGGPVTRNTPPGPVSNGRQESGGAGSGGAQGPPCLVRPVPTATGWTMSTCPPGSGGPDPDRPAESGVSWAVVEKSTCRQPDGAHWLELVETPVAPGTPKAAADRVLASRGSPKTTIYPYAPQTYATRDEAIRAYCRDSAYITTADVWNCSPKAYRSINFSCRDAVR